MLAPSYLGFLLTLDGGGDNIFAVAWLFSFFIVARHRNIALELFGNGKVFEVNADLSNFKQR